VFIALRCSFSSCKELFVKHRITGLFLGPILFMVTMLLPAGLFDVPASEFLSGSAGSAQAGDLAFTMRVVVALLLLMVTWWFTEAIPLPATALLPPVVLPWFQLQGLQDGVVVNFTFRAVLAAYANPVIFLFLGGFLLAAAMQKWGLDRRLTYWLITRGSVASDTHMVLLGMMILSALLSMWISNSATAAMLLPVGAAIVNQVAGEKQNSGFATAMMLGIAWSASIGGMGTLIGTPPNGIAVSILDAAMDDDAGYRSLSFLDWMKIGVPFVVLFLPVVWGLLLLRFPPEQRHLVGAKEEFQERRKALGRISEGERWTVVVFCAAVLLWVSNPFWPSILPPSLAWRLGWVDEFVIGLMAGLALFVIPVNVSRGEFVMGWRDTRRVDWGTLILFGGGIALSEAMFRSGVADWIARSCTGLLAEPSTLLLVVVIVLLVDFMTEIASNTAVATMMVPIVISIGRVSGIDPVTLAVGAALASSMAFMLPVSTPPNAIVFSTGRIRLGDMVRTGFILDILGWVFTVGILWLFGYLFFGVVRF
jgi:sodium-dependent dicarboxylate transporter 2/3/5